jgi:GcrA cell cycle regulator
MTVWTDARIAELTKLWGQGLSCTQVAGVMGCISRNAVIGKIHRLGLNGRAYHYSKSTPEERAERKRARAKRSNDARRAERQFLRVHPIRPAKPARPAVCEEITPLGVALIDLEPESCRWPYGDGPFTFCGHLNFHGSYCASHYFASIGEGTASERAAMKVPTQVLT